MNEREGPGLVRLNKFLASAGVASRRKADVLIEEGRVEVNGQVVTDLGIKIRPERDKVFVDGKQVALLDAPLYIVLNKPKDCITTTDDERGRSTVMEYVRVRQRVFPVGRLDRNTTGVLLLTNDGELANQLMHPRHGVKKAYKVTLDKQITHEHISDLKRGVELEDGLTDASEVVLIPGGRNKVVGISIHEGRNRQVRRMFERLGYDVKKLDRVAYGDITAAGLRRGQWRYVTAKEVAALRKLVDM
jgi:23S rRNA pseudouridine2605 synthase